MRTVAPIFCFIAFTRNICELWSSLRFTGPWASAELSVRGEELLSGVRSLKSASPEGECWDMWCTKPLSLQELKSVHIDISLLHGSGASV